MTYKQRRKTFGCKEDWAMWAVRVIRSSGGTVEMNEYRWCVGKDLLRGIDAGVKLGWIVCNGGPRAARRYSVRDGAPRPIDIDARMNKLERKWHPAAGEGEKDT